MSTLRMKYGSTGAAGNQDPNLIYEGVIDDANTAEIVLEAGGIYELFTAEWTASSGAYRGHRVRVIKVPEEDLYGTTACAYINEAASGNSGVTITMNSDSTISIARSSATYAVRYAVRRVI